MRRRLKSTYVEAYPSHDVSGFYSSFDIVGDLAIIKMPRNSTISCKEIASLVMARHRNIKSVFVQTSEVKSDYRLRGLAHVAGENRTSTVHKESGCTFKVDLARCYFSPRLFSERMRIAKLVMPRETIVNMFAGVGCFSIIIAKHVNVVKAYSIDINPVAVEFLAENVRLNGVYEKVIPILGDSKDIISDRLHQCADRVLMPLPEKSLEYLPIAVTALKKGGGWIHVHTFEHMIKAENISKKFEQKLSERLSGLNIDFEVRNIRVVRSTGPNWWQLVGDIYVDD